MNDIAKSNYTWGLNLVGLISLTLTFFCTTETFATLPETATQVVPIQENLIVWGSENPVILTGNESSKGIARWEKNEKGPVLLVETNAATEYTWSLNKAWLTQRAVKAKETLFLTFRVRCLKSMTQEGFVGMVFENSKGEEKSMERQFGFGQDWEKIEVPFQSKLDYEAGQAQISLRFGFNPQTIEISDLELISYGSENPASLPSTRIKPYAGMEADAPWRKAAESRIEQIRKADLKIRLVGANGRPMPGIKVRVEQQSHLFGFGTAVNAGRVLDQDKDSEKYREILKRYFNKAVLENDLKWEPWIKSGGPERAAEAHGWLLNNGFSIRGHCLVWPSWKFLPTFVKTAEKDPDKLRQIVLDRIQNAVMKNRGQVREWDVLNEPWSEHDLMDILGDEAMVEWFQAARTSDPEARLYINDFGILEGNGVNYAHQNHYEKTIQYLLDQKAPLGGIGFQGHFGSGLTPPEKVYELLDRFAKFKLPLQITEFDINIEDEAMQANYLRDFLTVCFSHPSVTGVMVWGFWEKQHWIPQASMFRSDWSPRPMAKVWESLVLSQWSTSLALTTDKNGEVSVRGFMGNYLIKINGPSGEKEYNISLEPGGSISEIKLE